MQFVYLSKVIFLLALFKYLFGTNYAQISLLDIARDTKLNKRGTLCNFKEIVPCNIQKYTTLFIISDFIATFWTLCLFMTWWEMEHCVDYGESDPDEIWYIIIQERDYLLPTTGKLMYLPNFQSVWGPFHLAYVSGVIEIEPVKHLCLYADLLGRVNPSDCGLRSLWEMDSFPWYNPVLKKTWQ